jgi:hypothetical protein
MNKVKASLTTDNAISKSLEKFNSKVSEQDLIEYFFSYTYKPNA